MFFKKRRNYLTIDKMYKKIVVLSRNKKFYVKLNVPDTIDGRFDMLLLFTIAVFFRLSKINPDGKILAQKLFDRFFMDLDYSLREIGTGDLTVGKKIKKLARIFSLRLLEYEKSINKDFRKIKSPIKKNIYSNKVNNIKLDSFYKYIYKINQKLSITDPKRIFVNNFINNLFY